MSANPIITANDIIQYLGNLLNIDVTGKLTVMDMIDDLSSIQDLADFRIFVKEKFNYERFRYLTGYQKFIALVNEYKKENAPKLDEKSLLKVENYSEKLFKEVTRIFDELNIRLQETGKSFENVNYEKTLLSNGLEQHQINVLNEIGNKTKIFALAVRGKTQLKDLIEEVVYKKTMIKHFPQLAPREDKEAKNLIEQLKVRV